MQKWPPAGYGSDKMAIVIENILCFIQSARDSLSSAEIQNTVEKFYKQKDIQKSKQVILDAVQEKPVKRRDVNKDIQDILEAFASADSKQVNLPTYAAVGLDAMPPASGYELIQDSLNAMSDEISSLKSEINNLKAQKPQAISEEIQKSLITLRGQMTSEFQKHFLELKKLIGSQTLQQSYQLSTDEANNSTKSQARLLTICAMASCKGFAHR